MPVKITAVYSGDDRVELTHGPTGSKLVTDLPPDNGGRGFSPADLSAASIASRILAIMAKIAERDGIKFEGASIRDRETYAGEPAAYSQIVRHHKIAARFGAQAARETAGLR